MYQEYANMQGYNVLSVSADTQSTVGYDGCLACLLTGLLKRPDQKEGSVLKAHLSCLPFLLCTIQNVLCHTMLAALQREQFWATSIALCSHRSWTFESCRTVFGHVIWGRVGSLLHCRVGLAVKILHVVVWNPLNFFAFLQLITRTNFNHAYGRKLSAVP